MMPEQVIYRYVLALIGQMRRYIQIMLNKQVFIRQVSYSDTTVFFSFLIYQKINNKHIDWLQRIFQRYHATVAFLLFLNKCIVIGHFEYDLHSLEKAIIMSLYGDKNV